MNVAPHAPSDVTTATGRPTASLKTLMVTVGVCCAVVLLYVFVRVDPHPFVSLVITLGPLVAAIGWLRADARARRVELVHDMGLFLWLAWPVLIPWYAMRTRGRHGLPLGLLVMLAIVGPILLATIIDLAMLLNGN